MRRGASDCLDCCAFVAYADAFNSTARTTDSTTITSTAAPIDGWEEVTDAIVAEAMSGAHEVQYRGRAVKGHWSVSLVQPTALMQGTLMLTHDRSLNTLRACMYKLFRSGVHAYESSACVSCDLLLRFAGV